VIFTDGNVDLPVVRRRVIFVLSSHCNRDFECEAKKVYGNSSVVVME
jgi:predicted metal-dependent peptidase